MSSADSSRLLLVRHGESEGNATRTFTGSTEVPLTDLGRVQARRAADVLARQFAPGLVVTSPYARARQTAEIIAAALSLELVVEADFHEQWLGDLRGMPYDAVGRDPAFDRTRPWDWRPPGGESLIDVQKRVVPALERLARAHAGREVVMVSHGGVMYALWAHAVGAWERARRSANAAVVLIEHRHGLFSEPTVVHPGGAEEPAETGG